MDQLVRVALDFETADAAIAYSVQKRWLVGEGEPPNSIRLTEGVRVWVAR